MAEEQVRSIKKAQRKYGQEKISVVLMLFIWTAATWFRIPAAKSSFATVAIFTFLWSYNDLFTQSFFLRYPQERAIAYMEKNYAEKLTLQGVADRCYVSQWHLSKLLNRYAGKSFYDILNSIRINADKELLADPSLKVGDISDRVGYADTAHFARTFKKLEGMSANEYRNKYLSS